jgi:hypothetical protein
MLLCKRFNTNELYQLSGVQTVYDRSIELIDGEDEGLIESPAFYASWTERYQGLDIDDSEWIDIRFSNDSPWLSIPEARLAIVQVETRISIQIRLRRSDDGTSPSLSKLGFGYHVYGSIISNLNDVALPTALGKVVELHRIIQSADAPIEYVNPARVTHKTVRPLADRFMVNFKYSPIVISTQGEFQGGEVPAILIRLESQSNRRELGIPQYLRDSEDTALRTEYSAVYDVMFEVNVIAQKTQDVSIICDRICQTIAIGLYLPPFGVSFGVSMSSQIIYDDPIRESDLAGLPTASLRLTVHNVPAGQVSKNVELITGINPVLTL